MQEVISFSGGRTSAYLVWLRLQKNPSAAVIFMDTGAEHPKTYDFIRNIAEKWDVNIICLRCMPDPEMNKPGWYEQVGIDEINCDLEPWRRMLRKYGHPYVGGAFCTDRMKTVPFSKYCEEAFGKGNYHTWLGIRTDEPKRLRRKEGFSYLADISDFEKQDVINWWAGQEFDLGIEEHLGNCVFCIKKSSLKVALAAKDEPYLAQQFSKMIDENDIKDNRVMYRGERSLEQVIALFEYTDRWEIAKKVKSAKMFDSGSCSESCEAIGFSGDEE